MKRIFPYIILLISFQGTARLYISFFILFNITLSFCAVGSTTNYVDSLYITANDSTVSDSLRLKAYRLFIFAKVYNNPSLAKIYTQLYYKMALEHPNIANHKATAMHYFGLIYIKETKLDSALICFKQGLDISLQHKSPYFICRARSDIGIAYEAMGKLEKALETHKEALKFAKNNNLKGPEARCYINIGAIHEKQGMFKLSLENFLNALAITKRYSIHGFMASVYRNLGNINFSIGEYSKAKQYYLSSLESSENQNNNNTKFQALEKLAELQLQLTNYDEAMQYYQKAYKVGQFQKSQSNQAITRVGMANVLNELKDYSVAKDLIIPSLVILEELKDSTNFYKAYVVGGITFLGLDDVRRSLKYANKGYFGAKRMRDIELLKKSSGLLYRIYKKLNNPTKALQYYEEYAEYKDKIRGMNEVKQVIKLEISTAYEKKASNDSIMSAKNLEVINLKHEQEVFQSKMNTWMAVVGLAVFFIIALFIYRNNQITKGKNRLISNQKDSLEKLNQLNKKIFSVISHDFNGPLISMRMLIETLQDKNLSVEQFDFYTSDVKNQLIQSEIILQNLLNWSKYELNELTLEQSNTNVQRALDEIIVESNLLAKNKNIQVLNLIPEANSVLVAPDILKIIFRNLINNAIKFSHEGGIVEAGFDDDSLSYYIKDEGTGMTIDQKEKLFNGVVKSTLGTNYESGFGLGLYITFELIKKSNGFINVESEDGQGSTFSFSFE